MTSRADVRHELTHTKTHQDIKMNDMQIKTMNFPHRVSCYLVKRAEKKAH